MDLKKYEKGAIALDFDGVINSYKSGFVGVDLLPDPPVEGAIQAIENYNKAGLKVYIYSTRNYLQAGRLAIKNYLMKYGLSAQTMKDISIVAEKPIAKIYVDDRGFHFTGEFPSVDFVLNFKPWHGGKSSSKK